MIKNTITILYVADQEKSKNFYRNILGIEPDLDVPGMTEFQISQNHKLGLMPEDGIEKILMDKVPSPKSANGVPRCELYLYVDNPKRYFKRALEFKAKLVSELALRNWGDFAGYVADPDGNVLAFAQKNNLK